MSWNARLQNIRIDRGLNKAELARRVGVSAPTVTDWESGKIQNIESNNLQKVARVLGVTVEFLLTGTTVDPFIDVPIINGDPLTGSDEREEIPAYKISVSAGPGTHIYTEEPNGSLGFRRGWIQSKGLSKKDLIVVQIEGDSMAPYIQHSDIVLVDMSKTDIRSGYIYVFRVDYDLRCKRLFKNLDGSVRVHSDNQADPRYQDEVFSTADLVYITILGAVVWRGGS